MGRWRRIEQWQQLDPPFLIWGQKGPQAVARRFRGTSTHKVDTKGRVSIPAPFRRVLEASDPEWTDGSQPALFILYGDHRRPWLTVYSVAAMEEVDAQIAAMPRGTIERQRAEDYFYANAQHLTVDESGRLILSKDLRDRVGITTEAVFKSAGDTFKIMAPEADAPEQARLRSWLDAQDESFDPASLLPSPIPLD